ncbi:MAG: 50S ribosomal protein L22 [Patescibacteria group bacterium]
MKAELKNYRQTPRKMRLVANLVRGQSVAEALRRLQFVTKQAAAPLEKLLRAAWAGAAAHTADDLVVSQITVDKGLVLKRHRAGARGTAFPIKHRTSRVMIKLASVKPKS